MIFQRLSRTDPERVFVVVRNTEGSALPANTCVNWETASASLDGVAVRQPDTGQAYLFAGVVDAQIAAADYGLLQVYGYRSSGVALYQSGTSIDTGAAVVASAGVGYAVTVATTVAASDAVTLHVIPMVLAESVQTVAASATTAKKVFIRAL